MTKHAWIFMGLSLLMTVLIWFNSSLNAELSGAQSGWVTSLVDHFLRMLTIEIPSDTLSFYVRKGAHFGQFFVLGALWFKTFDEIKKDFLKPWISALVLGVITAIIDESIQIFSPGRAFMVFDIIIDTLGVIMGILGVMVIEQLISNYKKRGHHTT